MQAYPRGIWCVCNVNQLSPEELVQNITGAVAPVQTDLV